jgi:hypothetical protein
VQVLDDHDERALGALAQPQTCERLVRPPAPDVGRHLLERGAGDAQQREEMGEGVLEAAVECEHLAGHLLAPVALVVVGLDAAVAPHELHDGQVGEGSPVRRASGVEHERELAGSRLELVEQARLPHARLSHDRDGPPDAARGLGQRLLQRRELGLAADEAREAAGGSPLERRLHGPDPDELVQAHRIRHALHPRRAERLEIEEAGGEGVGAFADHDAAGIGQALHALREPDGVADRHDVRLAVCVMCAPHDDLARVEADANGEAGPLLEPQSLGVAADVVLHAERRV